MDDLVGRRVLVVEDDYMIATEMAEMLAGAGAIPLGPVGWAEEALALARDQAMRIDLAILDVDLHGTPSYPIAAALTDRGIPVVFTTGFSTVAMNPAFRDVPRLEKPVSERALLAALRRHA